ncbi:hypothetical protein C5167_010850 [Papaver somniferum]|uniref:Signal peptidase I n=1 Tax=Papaver somniferum TaxID=3469 RepID=A0A4Y7K2V3_PAPSO|nr:uncharacterized protein LOC113289367 [Papaver somniferum]RZC67156.1 hypothetical protein C5167_010850 [Papaver somniferum]
MVAVHNRFVAIFLLTSLLQTLISYTVTTEAAVFNISNLLNHPLNRRLHQDLPPPPPSQSSPSHFLKDVLKVISARQNWTSEKIRVFDVDMKNVKVGSLQRYEFRVQFAKSDLEFKFADEVNSWKKLRKKGGFHPSVLQASSKTVLNSFELEGPFELHVEDGDDQLSLLLPLNTTHTGLNRVLVGEGITVKVKGAREISLFHASDFGLAVNRSSEVKEGRGQFWPLRPSLCMPLPPIRISGSAILVAYRTRNSDAHVETASLSKDMIELIPEKCYTRHLQKKGACPFDSLTSRLASLERLMKGLLGDRIKQKGLSSVLKAKISASTVIRFRLELEKDVKYSDTSRHTLAEWRTKPKVERLSFEVVARVDAEKLKPMVVKRLRPFIAAESAAWSILMSNISFTKFPSVLVPPEALTLDVKW